MDNRHAKNASAVFALGGTSCVLREEFPALRLRRPTPGSRSYDAGSLGHVRAATVEQSIADPKGK